jgi:AAA domain
MPGSNAVRLPPENIPVKISFTIFRDRYGKAAGAQESTLDELAAFIHSTVGKSKDELPLVKFALFGNVKTADGCLRNDSNVLSVTGVEADYDSGVMSFEEAVAIADKAGVYTLVYTSPSHTPERPRWRILAPFSEALPPEERDRLMGRLAGLYGGIFGSESWTLSQSYYLGRVDGRPIPQIEIVGEKPINEVDELDDTWLGKPHTQGNGSTTFKNGPIDEQALLEEIISGNSYHPPVMRLLGRWAFSGVAMLEAQARLVKAFECIMPPDRDERWRERYADIPNCIRWVYSKEAEKRDEHVEFTINGTKSDAADAPPLSEFILQHTSFNFWGTRELPQTDPLLGDLVTTTSRILLVGPTGLGKTNFLVPLGMTVADGVSFLHWCGGGKLRRVLYVDGEMSRRLFRARLDDAARRHGNRPATFFPLSREDFEDLPPLDTAAGQKYIDSVISVLGAIDLVIFDNLQALTLGDLRDPESWRKVNPWTRDLTRRCVGQIWVQHTGLDETHAYGDKTREWGLDTVMLMERSERPEADIAFRIRFLKARERTPDNRGDFEPTIVTLAGDTWTSERGSNESGTRKSTDLALDVLKDEIARGNGVIPPASERIPRYTPCITAGAWRKAYELRSLSESPEAAERAFYRAAKDLIEKRKLVTKVDLWVWPVR